VAPGSSCVEILAAIMRNINKAWDAQLRAAREQAVAKVINRHRKNEEDASKYKNLSANREGRYANTIALTRATAKAMCVSRCGPAQEPAARARVTLVCL
jgi:hypothetical protein